MCPHGSRRYSGAAGPYRSIWPFCYISLLGSTSNLPSAIQWSICCAVRDTLHTLYSRRFVHRSTWRCWHKQAAPVCLTGFSGFARICVYCRGEEPGKSADTRRADQEYVGRPCLLARIDHGKGTLSDRLSELTGTIDSLEMPQQVLDQMVMESHRGQEAAKTPVRVEIPQEVFMSTLRLTD